MHSCSDGTWTVPGRVIGALALALAIGLGALLRLVWVEDIEYKFDERWMFERAARVGRTEPWPALGMPSSATVRNPGLNVWLFVLLGRVSGTDDPTQLARGVQILNVSALVMLVAFILAVVPAGEREAWLWAAALVALNPLAVLFHRKIWQPSLFPLFTLAFLAGWWHRDRRWGALLWGVVGALLGQVQMGGFFLAAGFAAWAVLYDRRGVRWLSWFVGSCIGTVPLLPWLRYLLACMGQESIRSSRWIHLLEGKFWLRWVTEPLGWSIEYALEDDFSDFLRRPLVGGRPTYLVALLHVVLVLVGVSILAGALWRTLRRWPGWDRLWTGRGSATGFTQNAALWGYGLCLTASTVPICRHYLVVLFPLTFVWLARLALGSKDGRPGLARPLLATLCATQLLLSVSFLCYIHSQQRAIRGEYGAPYRVQVQAGQLGAQR